MNIEEAREYALSLPGAEESLFAKDWVQYRVGGKWFMLIWLNAPEQRVAVKLPPDEAERLRADHDGVRPAYHMNKRHWSDLYLNRLDSGLVRRLIEASYRLVVSKLPKKDKERIIGDTDAFCAIETTDNGI